MPLKDPAARAAYLHAWYERIKLAPAYVAARVAYQHANKKEKKRYDAARYAAVRLDPEKLETKRASARAATLSYYYRNREQQIAKSKAWGKSNREKHLSNKTRYRRRHPGALRDWHSRNPQKNGYYLNARRVRQKGNGGSHTLQQWLALVSAHGGACFYCARVPTRLTRDHAMPLTRGGTDDIDNIVPACQSCNSSKGTKTSKEFMSSRRAA